LLSNNKAAHRKGKVQLIDAGQRFRKLRKNLGNKNCEFAPEHIAEILKTYQDFATVERVNDDDIAAQVFDNQDFGYYKVTIERPKRLMAQFSEARLADLRFDKSLREPMAWAYETFGDDLYKHTPQYEKQILKWCEENDLNLNAKQQKALTSPDIWQKQLDLLTTASQIMAAIGTDVYNDFNIFKKKVDVEIKKMGVKLSASEKNTIFNAVSWYDATAEKVVKGISKFSDKELKSLCERLGCTEAELAEFGYFPTAKKGEYTEYETESDLRDTENVPLKSDIFAYFCREVKPHVPEAWINLEATKIGYEISFNKYFYRHKPLRSLEAVSADILKLDAESDGLIREILNL
jgi:type I restriction enzyme M protein